MSERLDEAGLKAATEALKPRGYGWPRTPELQAKWVVRAYLSALPVDEGTVVLRRAAQALFDAMKRTNPPIGPVVASAVLQLKAALSTDHSPPKGEG